MQWPGRAGAEKRQQFQQKTSAFQSVHSAGKGEAPVTSGRGLVDQNGGVLIYIGSQRLDAITDRDDAAGGNTVPDVFRPHMVGICEHHVVLLDQCETTGLRAVKRYHSYRVQSAATPRVKMKEAFPPKPAVAGIGRRHCESFASADASTLICMGKKHGGSNLQDLPLQFDAGHVVAIDHIGTPLS